MRNNLSIRTITRPAVLTALALVLFSQIELYAAKGDAKDKKGVVLKFNGFDLKGVNLGFLSLKPGVLYKGSFNNVEKAPQQTTLQSIVTYQKGNTTFILPYKPKVILPKFKTPEPPRF